MIDVGQIQVPEGSAADVLEFLEEISQLQQDIAADYRSTMAKISTAQAEASTRLLAEADSLSDEQFAKAAAFGLSSRVRNIAQASADEQRKVFDLVKRQLSIGLKEESSQQAAVNNASMLATYLERYGDSSVAADAYETFADLLKEANKPGLLPYVERFRGSARRLGLLGNTIDLTGTLVDGSEFDWDAYRGKVVLVDFWATWCGPCIAEAPNVRSNYDQYHDLGFEVVGISLDQDKKALEAYLEKEQVPWVNLFEQGAGWKHPMAREYGVNAIPAVWLVDRDGKVVSMNARGPELGNQLRKLFSSREDLERAIAMYNEKITPETTNAALISRRAEALASLGQWEQAAEDWERATKLQPSLSQAAFDRCRRSQRWGEAAKFGRMWVDQQPGDGIRWLMVAPVLLFADDEEGFREFCGRMVERFGDTKDDRESRLAIKACLLLPDAVELEDLPVETLVASTNGTGNPWGWGVRGILAYREGNPKAAVEFMQKSDQLRPTDLCRATNLPILAMAQHELGNDEAAKEALRESADLLKKLESVDANAGHNDLLISQILHQEASRKIAGKAD